MQFHKGWGEVTAHDVEFSFNDSLKEGSRYARLGELRQIYGPMGSAGRFHRGGPHKAGPVLAQVGCRYVQPLAAPRCRLSVRVSIDQKGEEGALTTMVGDRTFRGR